MAKTALMDASSAILLHRGALFTVVADAYRVVMAESVASEVTAANHFGAEVFVRLRRQGAFAVTAPPDGDDAGFPGALHAGERDTLKLYRCRRGDFVVTDDGRAAAYCRDAGIPYLNALLMPRILQMAGIVTAARCADATAAIRAAGRYADWVLRYAGSAADELLTPFLPAPPVTAPR